MSVGSRVQATGVAAGNLSRVVPVTLEDGRHLVIKIRPWQDRLVGCAAVQRHLALAGYPCPEPIAGPDSYSGWAISAEAARPGGHQRDPIGGADDYAQLLHRLITAGPAAGDVPSLLPSPAWTAWDHDESSTWPARDDCGCDLNEIDGPGWLDRAADRVRHALSSYRSPMRVGHGDWESQNIRWDGDAPLAVHDWDSVIAQPEPAIVGLASAVWPAQGGPGEAATVDQSDEFIAVYVTAMRRLVQRGSSRRLGRRLMGSTVQCQEGRSRRRRPAARPSRRGTSGSDGAGGVELVVGADSRPGGLGCLYA